MYKLILLPLAAKYIKKLKDKTLKDKFKEAIDEILDDPYAGIVKKGDLSGIYCFDVLHKKVSYEIAYSIYEENDKKVIVILAGTRENFYEQLRRYINYSR